MSTTHTHITKAVFPVAGLGTRFLPASKTVPKELFPVLDKPLIEYAVDEALSAGARDFIFVISPHKASITKHFEDDPNLVHVLAQKQKTHIVDSIRGKIPGAIHTVVQPQPLGLGHAIYCAKQLVGDNPFHVLLADDVVLSRVPCQQQLANTFAKTQSGVVAIEPVAWESVHKYGIVECDNPNSCDATTVSIKGFVEKPTRKQAPSNLSIIGRYILPPEIFTYLARGKVGAGGEIQITDAMADMLSIQPFFGVKFEGNRYDCGSKAGFLEAQIAAAAADADLRPTLTGILKKYI